jgi:hypothetical protein
MVAPPSVRIVARTSRRANAVLADEDPVAPDGEEVPGEQGPLAAPAADGERQPRPHRRCMELVTREPDPELTGVLQSHPFGDVQQHVRTVRGPRLGGAPQTPPARGSPCSLLARRRDGVDLTLALRTPDATTTLRITEGTVETLDPDAPADVTLTGPVEDLAAALDPERAADLMTEGRLAVDGSADQLRQLARLFGVARAPRRPRRGAAEPGGATARTARR